MFPANQAQDPNDPSKIGQEPDDPCGELRRDLANLANALKEVSSEGGVDLLDEEVELVEKYLTT